MLDGTWVMSKEATRLKILDLGRNYSKFVTLISSLSGKIDFLTPIICD